jgi:hypothetical protein
MRRFLPLIALLPLTLPAVLLKAEQGPTTRSMLEQLNRETRTLYTQVQTGLFRVQLPQPKWINAYAMAPISKWDKRLDPEVRKRLQDARGPLGMEIPAGSQGRPTVDDATTLGQSTYVAVRPQPVQDSDAVLGGRLELDRETDPSFAPNNVGLLLDEKGHLLVPLYVEREAVGDKPVPVAGPDGTVVDAKFIGSDRQTNLTLLEIQKISGKAVRLGKARPASGSLVLCLSTADGSGRLSLWTDGAQSNGVIVNTDAQVCGIARSGQFLAAPACELIAEHLARFGAVKRATLGITVSEIRDEDSPRPKPPAPDGRRPAIRVDDVIPGSVADKAGIKPGDLLISMAGEPVTDLPTFAAAIAARDGQTDLQLLRGDKVLTLSAYLQQQK